jgi:hypothetical protein
MAALEPAMKPLPVERRSSTPWLLRPRILYVSPLAGLAAAAALVAIITMSVLNTAPTKDLARDQQPDTGIVLPGQYSHVSNALFSAPFTYIDRTAKSVAVVGSFNDWDATKTVLTRIGDSVWTAAIPLAPGRYEYQLVVDGKWIANPAAQETAPSEFGAANSVIIVSPVPR